MNSSTLDFHRRQIRAFIRAYNRARWNKVQRAKAYDSAGAICDAMKWDRPQSLLDLDTILRRSSELVAA